MALIIGEDIVIASLLMRKYIWKEEPIFEISVGDCIRHQQIFSEIGLGTVIIENTVTDFDRFLRNLTECGRFEFNGCYSFQVKYRPENSGEYATFLRSKILESPYPNRVLTSLRLK